MRKIVWMCCAMAVSYAGAFADNIGIQFGIGPTFSPEMFYLSGYGDWRFYKKDKSEFSAGPALSIGVRSGATFIGPAVNARYTYIHTLNNNHDLRISADVGLGGMFLTSGLTRSGFMISPGFGADYTLNERWGLSSHITFHNGTGGARETIISWLFGVRYQI